MANLEELIRRVCMSVCVCLCVPDGLIFSVSGGSCSGEPQEECRMKRRKKKVQDTTASAGKYCRFVCVCVCLYAEATGKQSLNVHHK